mmetsp:Transcript_39408/g.70617  ORF Transcript_39408/g.70617 Transcript_39408/m.70617 type:complete len:608 (-) Transcript_39408:139-1962(-)
MPPLLPLSEVSTAAEVSGKPLFPLGEGGIVPPKAPSERERLAYLRGSGLLTTDFDAGYHDLTKAIKEVLKITCSYFSLGDQARMVFKAEEGLGMTEAPRDISFCPWNFLNHIPQVTTISDAETDARFTTNPLITGGMAKCYSGAPIQADSGYRVGTLCVIGATKRRFVADEVAFIGNLAQMLSREIDALTGDGGKTLKTVLLVNTHQEGCPVLFANAAALEALGGDRSAIVGAPLLDVLQLELEAGATTLRGAAGDREVAWQSWPATAKASGREFTATARSAVRTPLYDDASVVGAPAYVEQGDSAVGGILFVELQPREVPTDPPPIVSAGGVALGPAIGESGRCRVHRGVCVDGSEVAVRVVKGGGDGSAPSRDPVHERAIFDLVSHPHVVALLMVMPVGSETWMVMELCNGGTLAHGAISGLFRVRVAPWGVDMRALLRAATQVAEAIVHCHSLGVVHGNLSASNVLMHRQPNGELDFKVTDFSQAVLIEEGEMATTVVKGTCKGTVGYMPPEAILECEVGFKTDVYAFGVLLWEMFHGERAWESVDHNLVIARAALNNERPPSHDTIPPALKHLIEACWSADPKERPLFMEVLQYLRDMEHLGW